MPKVSTEFIAVGANRTAHTAAWGLDGLIAFGANKLIALYNPLVHLASVALVSGSADNTAKIWKKNSAGQWINSATLTGHTGAVETIACMRGHSIKGDTDLLATGSADGTIRIWERRIIDESNGNIRLFKENESVPILASGNTDKVISIYIHQHGSSRFERAHTLQGHDNWVRSLAFATYTGTDANVNEDATHTLKTGNLMLASASQDKYIRLWKIAPEEKREARTDAKSSANTGQSNDLSDVLEALQETLLMGHDDWVYSVNWERPRYSADIWYIVSNGIKKFTQPLRLISASSDKSLMIWSPDLASGVWVNEVRMGDMGGNSYLGFCGALFSPDGKHVVSHGANGSFHMWRDVSTEDEENRWTPEVAISGHFKPVESVAWDPHSRYLLSASLDQSTRLYAPWSRSMNEKKVVTWHEMGRPQVHGYDLKCVAFVNDWEFVSGADEKVLRVFDAPKSCVESLAVLTGEKELASEVESRPIGANLPALGLSNKAVFAGDIETMVNSEENHATLQSYAQSSSTPTSLLETMIHPPFEEHLLQHTLWPEVEKLYGHGYEIICTEATHDGKYVASACKAATPEHAVVRLFDTSNWKEVKAKINAHSLTVTRVRFSHNDRWLLTVSRDRVWSISERVEGDNDVAYRLISKNQAHARIIWDCAWSHDDRFFVTGSRDKTVKIWTQKDGAQWSCVATIKCAEAVTALDAAPAMNGQIELLSAKEGKLDTWTLWHSIEKRLCHAGVVRSLAWRIPSTPGSRLQLASAGEDHSVRILNVESA
ncbi:quinon protein alcohol dehydrogenase-like superfamily [Phycomyces nitens]|nr:quinon protein alcohol dehydrogenase-like superfamily [Phycomyces nitens]